MSEVLTKLLAMRSSSIKVYLVLEAAQRGAGSKVVRSYRKDIAPLIGRSESTVSHALHELRTNGLIHTLGMARYGVVTH